MVLTPLAVLALLGPTACGDGAQPDAASPEELTEVTVGIIPIIDVAPLYLGIEQGFFADRGIEVSTQQAQGGAAIVPAVVAGEYQFGFSNIVSMLIARDRGLPLDLVAIGARASEDVLDDGSGQMMATDASIGTVEDLVGRRVAINTLAGITEVAVRASLDAQGVDADQVQFVEIAIPDMPSALTGGQVDAAVMAEPFTTLAARDGARPLPVSYAAMNAGAPFAGWFTTETQAQEQPEVTQRFTEALEESLRYATDNPDEARAALDEYLDLPDGIGEEVTLPGWDPTIDEDQLRRLAELTAEYGFISSPDVLDDLLAG
ncbi:ABC transporter substrate-binding protein [Geodermatophilus marinus]|uniref:ABC transporter substrate-binding protein n=1 Tax=Geodermatophilus sp. LHW52908 TaxID=2303986 RepID=UPI0018F47645|nr:ABC transporter substrate-binding protein [Geodermatophilus sp. LHW52908]